MSKKALIIEDDGNIGIGDHHPVEAHPRYIKAQRLLKCQMMEELGIDQINHPSADRKQKQHHQQPERQLQGGLHIDGLLFFP